MLKITTSKKFKKISKNRIILTGSLKEKASKLLVFSQDEAYKELLQPLFQKKIYQSQKEETISLYDQMGAEKIFFCSLNDLSEDEKIRHFSANLVNAFKKSTNLEIDFSCLNEMANFLKTSKESFATSFLEGISFGSYEFTTYSSTKKFLLQEATLIDAPIPLSPFVKKTEIISSSFALARDLVNEPPNSLNARTFSALAKKKAKENGLTFESLDNKKLAKNNLAAILAVNAGSKEEARLVTLKYSPPQARKSVLLVGKGVTFDSGGLSLKPSKAMEGMKMDMSGAAVVFATLLAVKQLRLPLEVIGLMPLTDNLTGSSAYKVGDVIKTHSGKTVEVLNTDAEGRLILADALSYGLKKYKVDYVIDLATLTGACLVALGVHYAALYTHDEDLSHRLVISGKESGEKVWPMPLDEVYNEELKSSLADLKNIGGPYGGSITAAKFLENFISAKLPWAHLDIASTMEHTHNRGYFKKGGSGFGVRLLVRFLENLISQGK